MNPKRALRKANNRKNRIAEQQEDSILDASALAASRNALRISRALNLKITYIRNGKIMRINPDTSIVEIRSVKKSSRDLSGLKKGMLLKKK